MHGVLHWTKDIQNAFLFLLRGVWVEEDWWLVSVNFLPCSRFIAIKDIDKFLTFLVLCFAKKEDVIDEEEMSDYWAASIDGNSIDLLVSGSFMDECWKAFSAKEKKARGERVAPA